MKTTVKTLALLLLLGFFGSSCETVSRLNTEYEEEIARVEKMNPEEKANLEKARHEQEEWEWFSNNRDGE